MLSQIVHKREESKVYCCPNMSESDSDTLRSHVRTVPAILSSVCCLDDHALLCLLFPLDFAWGKVVVLKNKQPCTLKGLDSDSAKHVRLFVSSSMILQPNAS